MLVVPAAEESLEVAVDLPNDCAILPKAGHSPLGGGWQLVEADHPELRLPANLVPSINADGTASKKRFRLLAIIPPRPEAKQRRRFMLEAADSGKGLFQIEEKSPASLVIREGTRNVLKYNYGVVTCDRVPKSDSRRSRGCYIHPLWGLQGEVLTDDFPKDHYHHHGVFWAWPHVGIDGKQYDLWMYKGIEDRFVEWLCRQTGPTATVIGVENGWFVGKKKVMIERVWIRIFLHSDNSRSIDLEFVWIPVDRPITLRGAEEKSYGGLTVRFHPRSQQNTVITVPSGKTKEDLTETPLTWADFTTQYPLDPIASNRRKTTGEVPTSKTSAPNKAPSNKAKATTQSGAAIFVHPEHPDYPPTWLTRHYGPLCVGWPGVKGKTFEPGQPIHLSYRLWIHKKAVGLDRLKTVYSNYCLGTKAVWQAATRESK